VICEEIGGNAKPTLDCLLLLVASAQVLYDSAHLKSAGPIPVLRPLTLQLNPLAGFQIDAPVQKKIGLVILVIDDIQSFIATLDTAG